MEKRGNREDAGQELSRPGEGERESRGGGFGGGANPITPTPGAPTPGAPGAGPEPPPGRERIAPVSPAESPLEQPEGGGPMHRRHV